MGILAMDFGLKRMGLAIEANGLALPLNPIIRKNRNQAAGELKAILEEKQITTLIVGIPLGGNSEAEMKRRIAHFLTLVEFKGELFFENEADTSLEAEETMKGIRRDKKDGRNDSLAARIILERWLSKNTFS